MQEKAEKINRIFNHPRFNLIAFFTIATLVLVAYSNTFHASFHFDDNPAIVDNYAVKVVSGENIIHLLSINRPVVNLSLMLNYSLSGLNPVGWHIFNIGCHIANSFLVYLLILWTLQTPALEKRYAGRTRWMALFGALLFGVHPIQTESVTYIISRTELLATLFYLGAFLLFIQGARKKNFAWFIGAACSAFLSAGSKEWAVTLPAMLFLYDVLFLSEGKIKPALSRWPAYLLITLSWTVIARTLNLVAGTGQGASVGFNISNSAGIPLNPWTYLLTSFNVIWTYFRLLVLPVNQNLDYEYPVARTLFELPTFLSFIGHVAVVTAAFWLYKKKSWLLLPFGLAWFYITLSPVQSFVPVMDVIFEHRLYLPSIGFIMAFMAAYAQLFEWLAARRVVKANGGSAVAQQK
jgi:protein O-mannosyl-transferase